MSDDENSQAATKDAFEVLHFIASKRLAAGRLTVIDATNVQQEARQPLVALAREYHTLPVAIVFNLPEEVCQDRNRERADRNFGPHVIRQQRSQLAAIAQSSQARGISPHLRVRDARGSRGRHHRADAALERPPARAWPVRLHRRRAWLLR